LVKDRSSILSCHRDNLARCSGLHPRFDRPGYEAHDPTNRNRIPPPHAFTPPPAPLNLSASRQNVFRLPTPQHAPQATIPRILPYRTFDAMRERLRTTLILRLPAPCHVATQGLPASARLCASGRIGPGCSLRSPATGRHRCERSSHGARRVGLPFGPASGIRPPSRRACSTSGAFSRLRRSRVWRSAHCRRGPPRCARPRRVRLRLNAFAFLSPPREPPTPFAFPPRLAAFRISRHHATRRLAPTRSPAAHFQRGFARDARSVFEQGLAGAPSQLPASGVTICAHRLPARAES
jgi:hypothetical protein